MSLVVINHEYTPYSITAHFVRGHLCSVLLKNRSLRVLHINTGLALQAFRTAQDAKALMLRISRDEGCNKIIGDLTWRDYTEHTDLFVSAADCINMKLYNLDIIECSNVGYFKRAKII